jgi:2-keto-4-pentenoate hydratase
MIHAARECRPYRHIMIAQDSRMSPHDIEAAALHLLTARRHRREGPRMPPSCRPERIKDALAIQRQVALLLGEPVGGWKCSLPTPEKTVVAPIYAATICTTAPCSVQPQDTGARIEPEVAFVLAQDLPPRREPYTEAEVRAAIGETRLVLELMGSRYADPASVPFPEMLADSANNYGLYVGPVVPKGLERTLDSFPITITGPGGAIFAREGRHPDGHPLQPLVWLANWFATGGADWRRGLTAGQIVTTGSYVGAVDVPLATPLTITFGELGKLEVTLLPVA